MIGQFLYLNLSYPFASIYLPTCQYHYVYYVHVVLSITCLIYIYYNITCILYITCTLYITVSSSDGTKKNGFWPFQSEKDKTLDEEANLPPPQIDEHTGMYCLMYTSFADSAKIKYN